MYFLQQSGSVSLRSEQDLVVAWLVGEQRNVGVELALGIAAQNQPSHAESHPGTRSRKGKILLEGNEVMLNAPIFL